jgi:pfkB family carbohydrate kinase
VRSRVLRRGRRAAGWAGCVLVSTEIPEEAVVAAVRTAAAEGLPYVLNSAPVLPGLATLLDLRPVLTPNATEVRDLHGLLAATDAATDVATVKEMAAGLASRTKAAVVVTLGGEGALVASPDGTASRVPPHATSQVRDTTGAGDTFNGVLAAALANGLVLETAIRRATVAASLSVSVVGARAGMPTGAEIDAAMGPDGDSRGAVAGLVLVDRLMCVAWLRRWVPTRPPPGQSWLPVGHGAKRGAYVVAEHALYVRAGEVRHLGPVRDHLLVSRPADGEADHAVGVVEAVLDGLSGFLHRVDATEVHGEYQPELPTGERVGVIFRLAGVATGHGCDDAGAVVGESLVGPDPFDCRLHVDGAFWSRGVDECQSTRSRGSPYRECPSA